MSRSIRFLSHQIYETQGPGKGPEFKEGSVLAGDDVASVLGMPSASDDFVAAFLQRWVGRGVAVYEIPGAEVTDTLGTEDGDDGEDVDLTKMSRKKLDALAAERGVDVSAAKTRADVIAALGSAASSDGQS